MRKKLWMLTIVYAMSMAVLGGCGNDSATDSGTQESEVQSGAEGSAAPAQAPTDEDAIYGEVSKVGTDTITIKVGTRKQMDAQPSESSSAENADQNGDSEKGAPSMLDLTGEKQKITITDSTQITRMSMGGMGQGGQGGAPQEGENGQQKPEGTPPAGGDGQQKPEGTPPAGGDGQQKPEGTPPAGENGQQNPGGAPGETISISDISVGDTVQITLDDDGNAETIQVMSSAVSSAKNDQQSQDK